MGWHMLVLAMSITEIMVTSGVLSVGFLFKPGRNLGSTKKMIGLKRPTVICVSTNLSVER